MKLDLAKYESFPVTAVLETKDSGLEFTEGSVKSARSVSVRLDIQQSDEEYFCQGEIDAGIVVECSRCLGSFDSRIVSRTDFVVCSESTRVTSKGAPVDSEDYLYFDSGSLTVDLTRIVKEAILLEVSMKPICSEECRGLCPVCGMNCNTASCQCVTRKIDPRWEKLGKLFLDKNVQAKER